MVESYQRKAIKSHLKRGDMALVKIKYEQSTGKEISLSYLYNWIDGQRNGGPRHKSDDIANAFLDAINERQQAIQKLAARIDQFTREAAAIAATQ